MIIYARSLRDKNKNLKNQIENLENQNRMLKDKLYRNKQKLLYVPEGNGYYEAKSDFMKRKKDLLMTS